MNEVCSHRHAATYKAMIFFHPHLPLCLRYRWMDPVIGPAWDGQYIALLVFTKTFHVLEKILSFSLSASFKQSLNSWTLWLKTCAETSRHRVRLHTPSTDTYLTPDFWSRTAWCTRDSTRPWTSHCIRVRSFDPEFNITQSKSRLHVRVMSAVQTP